MSLQTKLRRKRKNQMAKAPKANAQWINSVNKQLGRIQNKTQYKIHDTEYIGVTSAFDAVYIDTINSPAQGTEDYERIGDQIVVHDISCNYKLQVSGSPATIFRVMLIHDFNNTITTAADIFSGYSANVATPQQPIVWDNRNNFKILYNALIPIRGWLASAGDTNISAVRSFSIHKQFLTRFEAGSTTINKGAIKLVLTSDAPTSGTKPTFTAYVRVIYADA